MPLETTPFDAADHIGSAEDAAHFLAAAFDEANAANNPGIIADALGMVARARNMTELARKTGLPRQTLYKALSADGNPELGTVVKVLGALGLRLTAVAA